MCKPFVCNKIKFIVFGVAMCQRFVCNKNKFIDYGIGLAKCKPFICNKIQFIEWQVWTSVNHLFAIRLNLLT